MRFANVRHTVIKGIDTAPDSPASPRRLSPYIDERKTTPRSGVNPLDISHPTHSRRSRRAMGLHRARQRLGGVALIPEQMPWKPVDA